MQFTLSEAESFSRVIGSGIAFLDRYETIREIIDLRPQIKNWQSIAGQKTALKLKVHIHLGMPDFIR